MSESAVDSTQFATTRRTLVRGAAWSVPVISVAAAAPAFAVSCDVATSRPVTWAANSGSSNVRTQSGTTAAGGSVTVNTSYTKVNGDYSGDFNSRNMNSVDRSGTRGGFVIANTVPDTNSDDVSSNYQSVTFTFSPAARELTFKVEDIDRVNNGGARPGFYDYVRIISQSPWTAAEGSFINGTGYPGSAWRTRSDVGNLDYDSRQTVTVSFAGPVSQFTLDYGSLTADSRYPEFMFVVLSGMTYKVCS